MFSNTSLLNVEPLFDLIDESKRLATWGRSMALTLRITITMTDGAVFEIEEECDIAKSLMHSVPMYGYRDPRTAKFYPADAILTIDVTPPTEPIRFSDN